MASLLTSPFVHTIATFPSSEAYYWSLDYSNLVNTASLSTSGAVTVNSTTSNADGSGTMNITIYFVTSISRAGDADINNRSYSTLFNIEVVNNNASYNIVFYNTRIVSATIAWNGSTTIVHSWTGDVAIPVIANLFSAANMPFTFLRLTINVASSHMLNHTVNESSIMIPFSNFLAKVSLRVGGQIVKPKGMWVRVGGVLKPVVGIGARVGGVLR